jgi:hypothetical protein
MMYINKFNPRTYKISYVPCLTPGCNNTPLNIRIANAVAQLEYNLKSDPKTTLKLDCARCGRSSEYTYESILEIMPKDICPVPLPKDHVWTILLLEIPTGDEMEERGFFGERLLVCLTKKEGIDWNGELLSESQFAPTLQPGTIVGGRVFNKYYVCEFLLKSNEVYELPLVKDIPNNSDFGLFFVPKRGNVTHLQCANLFCKNPSCAHTFGLTYSQLKDHNEQGKDIHQGLAALCMLSCELCGNSMVAALASFDNLYKV